ncbi:MAG: cobalamin-binding protein [Pseudomonadota bacterium]
MIRSLLAGLCALLVAPAGASAIHVTDDTGRALTFSSPPQRIVSLAPHLTELVYAVGAGAQVVGVDSFSDYPQAAGLLPRVGDASRIRFERILALKPDLILAWTGGNRSADLHGVAQLGIPVLHTEARRIADVARLLRLIGEATGHADAGERTAQAYELHIEGLRERHARADPVPVFYQIWDRPLMTVGGLHWIDEALAVCGARNIFHDIQSVVPAVSREAVLRRRPAVILGGTDARDMRRIWKGFANLPAVRNDAFVNVDADLLHRAGPRLAAGVAGLCAALDAYER